MQVRGEHNDAEMQGMGEQDNVAGIVDTRKTGL
jgi:hypothetical protein